MSNDLFSQRAILNPQNKFLFKDNRCLRPRKRTTSGLNSTGRQLEKMIWFEDQDQIVFTAVVPSADI